MKELTLLFLVRGEEVLLAYKKRGFGADRWNGVGGKIENDETIEQGAIRECQEEISVTPIDFYKAAEIHFEEFHEGKVLQLDSHIFIVTKWEGEPTESEEVAPEWYNKHKLPFDNMWLDDPEWLPKVLDGKKLRARFKLDHHDQLVESHVTIVSKL